MMGIMIAVIVVLALIGVPMSFSVLAGSVWYFLSSGMPQTLLIQRLIMAVGDSFRFLRLLLVVVGGLDETNLSVLRQIQVVFQTFISRVRDGLFIVLS
ncbi:MAG TPA: hypothetical protein IAC19_03170, partial [Candidatus Ventricola gallistercoris]|nr:hypothetical protein [Candidatus Ventricola gallistercoris]